MKFRVFSFGKMRLPGTRDTANYHLRNIQPWIKVEETELKPERVDNPNPKQIQNIREKEAQVLNSQIAKLSRSRKTVVLDETGKSLSTEQWAKQMKSWQDQGVQEVAFAVGSSWGWKKDIKADLKVSLGPQTLAHDLARVVLYEQLYRAQSVLAGHPYHNQ